MSRRLFKLWLFVICILNAHFCIVAEAGPEEVGSEVGSEEVDKEDVTEVGYEEANEMEYNEAGPIFNQNFNYLHFLIINFY